MRNPKEVTKEEYSAFCKSTFKEFIDPQAYTHFTTEVRPWYAMDVKRGQSIIPTHDTVLPVI